MTTRVKFLLLLFLSFGGTSLLAMLFMSTDYARNEKAYFNSYPYREMTLREINYPAKTTKTVTTAPVLQENIEVAMKILPNIQTAVPQKQKAGKKIKLAKIITSKTEEKPPTPKKQKILRKIIPTEIQQESKLTIVSAPFQTNETNDDINIPEEDWLLLSEMAYDAYEDADYEMAIMLFKRALEMASHKRNMKLQLAYAYKLAGKNSLATKNFMSVIDQYDKTPVPFSIRREVEQLENQFEANGYIIYRDESSSTRQLGADLTQSQTGFEVSYRPEDIGLNNRLRFQIYGRLLAGLEQDQLTVNPDSYQGGIGIRLRPLPNHNLVLSAERLVKVGKFARNDWMLRAGYSLDHGTDYREDKTGWWSYSLYLDAALIDPGDPDIFLTSQATGGYSMIVTNGLVLQPRMTALASWQKDSFHKARLYETGPGMNIRYYFNETKYEAYRSYIDLTIEYRLKLSGNSIGGSGPVVSLLVHF